MRWRRSSPIHKQDGPDYRKAGQSKWNWKNFLLLGNFYHSCQLRGICYRELERTGRRISTHPGAPIHRGGWGLRDLHRASHPHETTYLRRDGSNQRASMMDGCPNHNIQPILREGAYLPKMNLNDLWFWQGNSKVPIIEEGETTACSRRVLQKHLTYLESVWNQRR